MKTSSSWIPRSRLRGETTGTSLRGLVAGRLSRVFLLLGCAITALLLSSSAQAATRIKANNANDLNLATSWDTLPGVADIASWTSTVTTANTVALGADLNWSGISIVGPGGLVTISAGNTLTLGSAGIDMSLATQDLTIQSGLALQSGVGEIWNIATGRTLTLGTGAFTRTAGSTLNVQGAGTVATTNISNDATGIVGTWATSGAGASTKYATVSGGNIVGYTGTAAATAANVTDTTGTVNYDVAAVGTLGAGAAFNTLRYTGASGNINGNFSANGILSAGAGALFMTGNISIGASRELVVTVPDTPRNLTLSGIISDNASGSSALTKSGGTTSSGYLYLSGANTYTGLTTVSQGVLSILNSSALGSANVGTVVTSAGRMEFQNVANSAELFYFNTIGQSTYGVIGNSTQSGAIRTYGGLNFSGAVTGSINFTGGISTTNGATGSSINIAQGSALTESITVKPVSIGGGTMNSYGGTLVIGVAGNTWGASALYGGTWRTDVADALPTAATLSFDSSGTTPASLLNLNGNSQTIGGISTTAGGYKVAGGFTREITSSTAATLTVSQISNNLNFDGAFTGAVSLVKAGLSTSNLHLTGVSTTTGSFTVNSGMLDLTFGKAYALASGASAVSDYLPTASPMILGGGTFQVTGRGNGTVTSLTGTAGNGTAVITVASTTGLAPGQAISGTGLPAGAYIVSIVDGTKFVINANTTAALAGTQTLTANSFTTSQTFAGLTLNAGASVVSVLIPSSGSNGTVLNLGAITPNAGGTVNFTLPTGTQSATNGITTSTTNTNSILGGWARVGNDWAINSTNAVGGNIAALATYTDVNRLGGTITSNASSNIRIITGGGSGNITPAAPGVTDINTLKGAAGDGTATYNPGTTDILRLGASGGILLPTGVTPLTIGAVANDGILTAGGADNTAGTIYLTNNHSTSILTINSIIADNGTGVVSLTTSGAGTTKLFGNNTYTGRTIIGGGTLSIASEAALGSNPGSFTADQIILAGGTLNNSATSFSLNSNRGITLAAAGGNFSVDTGTTLTVANVITGPGSLTKSGNGTLALTAANTHTGVTVLTANMGPLALGNVNALQNSTLDAGVVGTQSVTFTVAGTNTYNVGGLQGANAIALGANTISVGANNATTTYTGIIGGTGGLTKVGAGTLNLTNASTYSGNTLVSGGMLVLANLNALQNSTVDTGSVGAQSVNLTATGTYNLGGLQGANGLDMAVSNLSVGSNNQSTTFSGVLTGAFGNNLTKVGTGTLTLSGANTYGGATTVNGGILTFLHTGAKASGTVTAVAAGSIGLGVGGAGFYSSADVDSLFTNTLTGFTLNAASGVAIDTSAGNFTYTTNQSASRALTKLGANSLTLNGTNTYSGGTTVTAGTLILASNSAAGSAGIVMSGDSSATLQISSGVTIANNITFSNTNAGSSVSRLVANATAYTAGTSGNLTSAFVGGQADTTARILAGTNAQGFDATLTMKFSDTSAAANDGVRKSDVFSLNGTATDLFTLQLSVTGLDSASYLGWLNGGSWVNAVSGNTGNNASGAQLGYLGSFSAFQTEYTTDLTTYVGAYGVDISGGSTWAVLNHNSDYAAVPEPATWALLAGVGTFFMVMRRRRRD